MLKKLKHALMNIFMSLYSKFPVALKRFLMRIIHFLFRYRKLTFEVHLAEHCNLNCKGCDNYSPIAEKSFVDINELEREFLQMKAIFKNHLSGLKLLGGEPLLHPDIDNILILTRRIFPAEKIIIISNGLLLPKMSTEFYDICKRNDIRIMLTKYPINFDYDGWIQKINGMGINCDTYSNEPLKTLYRKPLDLSGQQDKRKMYDLCLNANRCVSLKDGKLYTCTTIPNICHFNKFFEKNLEITEEDSIDIFKETNYHAIRRKLSKCVPFCRYCNIEGEEFGIPWGASSKDIREWGD